MRKNLTSKFVESVRAGNRRIEFRDTLLPGFGMRASASGKRTWFAVGRVHTRQVRHTIGSYPAVSLAEAREAARLVLRDMQLGTYTNSSDLTEQPKTLEQVIVEFIEIYAKPKNRGWKAVKATLRKFSTLYDQPISELKRADIVKVLDGIVASGSPVAANRAMSAIKKVFAWSLDRGVITVHPLVGLKKPGRERSRDRLLDDSELRAFWQATDDLGFPFGPALQILLLTGQRRGEVSAMRWSQIDSSRGIWTIPADIAKNARPHQVPLSGTSPAGRTIPRPEGGMAGKPAALTAGFQTRGRSPASRVFNTTNLAGPFPKINDPAASDGSSSLKGYHLWLTTESTALTSQTATALMNISLTSGALIQKVRDVGRTRSRMWCALSNRRPIASTPLKVAPKLGLVFAQALQATNSCRPLPMVPGRTTFLR